VSILKQELSYRKQIARQLHTQYVDGMQPRDLEIYANGNSTLSKMVPFDRP